MLSIARIANPNAMCTVTPNRGVISTGSAIGRAPAAPRPAEAIFGADTGEMRHRLTEKWLLHNLQRQIIIRWYVALASACVRQHHASLRGSGPVIPQLVLREKFRSGSQQRPVIPNSQQIRLESDRLLVLLQEKHISSGKDAASDHRHSISGTVIYKYWGP